jgi:hypothetical protein
MLKTNKEIEEEFDENFKYFCQEHSCCFGNGEELKSFIHQTRIADLEEMEKLLIDEKEKFEPAYGLDNETVIFAFTKIISHIQKLKEEIVQ